VAIKCCHPHLCNDEDFVSMFLDEARLAARIHHPNVVPTLDVHYSDYLYLVMDYVEGGNFASLLRHARKSGGHLPVDIVLAIMIDVLNGLHAAHELRDGEGELLNLVHRDVSPQNVLVGVDGVARLTDFGIALAAVRFTVTEAGRLKGKLSYMAPEQIQGHAVDRRTDIFAAGCVLWEALVGRSLFRSGKDVATKNAVLVQVVPRPSSLVPAIPAAFDEVVLKALEREPHKRYATAGDFADALERLPVRRATTREVAASVQAAFGSAIAQRHEVLLRTPIRHDPSSGSASGLPPRSGRPRGNKANATGESCEQITLRMDGVTLQRLASVSRTWEPGGAPVDDFEHRRVRSILAAVMLLLVGSAIGLLLARSGRDSTRQADPPSTSATASDSTK
jgi:serine/threonine-protein kinase